MSSASLLNSSESTCDNIYHCRTIWSIVWSCLATVMGCTLAAVHPNIPNQKERQWTTILRRAGLVGFTLIAPEVTILWAMRQWVAARKLAKEHREYNWTRTHGFFALMGGFLLFDGETPAGILPPHLLKDCLRRRQIRITREEINDKSQRDWVSKGLILVQTTWFMVQCLTRVNRHLPITELEVITLAFAVLNFITHALWWSKPQNVGCPIPVSNVSAQDELFGEHALQLAEVASVTSSSQVPSPNTSPRLKCNRLSTQSQTSCVEVPYRVPVTLSNVSGPSRRFNDQESDAQDGQLPIVYDTSRDMIKQKLEDIRASGAWGERLHPVIFWTISPLLLMLDIAAKIMGHEKFETGAPNVPMFYAGNWSIAEQQYIGMGASLVATMFGGLHLIAWSYEFPTYAEKILWRSSTIVLICTPTFFTMHRLIVGLAYSLGRRQLPPLFGWETILTGILFMAAMVLYLLARIFLLLLAVTSLRALPPGAYQTVSWIYFIPHV